MLTEQDDGRLVSMTVDESVALRLSGDMTWETPRLDGTAVTIHPVDYFVDPGYQEWIIEAITSGTAVVRIDGVGLAGTDSNVEITFTVEGPL